MALPLECWDVGRAFYEKLQNRIICLIMVDEEHRHVRHEGDDWIHQKVYREVEHDEGSPVQDDAADEDVGEY